jgi:lipocalin
MKKYFFIMAITLVACSGCQAQERDSGIDRTTVSGVELNRYLGKWYEIARFDHSFERDLTGVTATYSLRPDGKIKVVNEGYKGSLTGKHKVAVGKAKIPDPKDLSTLKVSFFLNFYSDYLILELDQENYQYVLIGSNSDRYLWILSRTPKMPEDTLNRIVSLAKNRGYDVDKLIFVEQKI